ncbi:acyltransferase domain-containing protein [Streptomyces zhihengii]
MSSTTAVVFPGQGSFRPGILESTAEHVGRSLEHLQEIDAITASYGYDPVIRTLTTPADPAAPAPAPGQVDLLIFATSVAAFDALPVLGVEPDVLTGHSFGEWAGLVCAGALSLDVATRLVCERLRAFDDAPPPPGGMLALSTGSRRAAHLIGLVGDHRLALAVDNGPDQCVLSGPHDLLDSAATTAGTAGVQSVRLQARTPFHNPVLLADAAAQFVDLCAGIRARSPRVPFYSPLLRRPVTCQQDVRELAARHLLDPVHFYEALLHLHGRGVRRYVECGGGKTLTGLVESALPATATARAPWAQVRDWPEVRAALEGSPPSGGSKTGPRHEQVRPEPKPVGTIPSRVDFLKDLKNIYAERLGFPEELLADDVDIEAELGVDSIKQLEAFALVRNRHSLPAPDADLRVTSYTTFPALAGLLEDLARRGGETR